MAKPQRGKPSQYQIRLPEKQKPKRTMMMTETPLVKVMADASRSPGNSAAVLLATLETRLDNIVRRLGFATSVNTARQLVSHGHVRVNGKQVDIPSFGVRVGQEVSLNPAMKDNVGVKLALDFAEKKTNRPAYLAYDAEKLSGKLIRQPGREESSFPVNDRLIVEYYSR